jgi:tricorn protease interacting factor F2/3
MQPIIPIRYEIRLEPDLHNFKFEGYCELYMDAVEAVTEVTLNVLEIAVWSCQARKKDEFVKCAFTVDPRKETLRIILPEPMSGQFQLKVHYQGVINDKMAGFYRSHYTYQGKTRSIAVTQFEESDARRAFPCMDHPAKKAVFDIQIDIERDLVAISNSAVIEEELFSSTKKRVVFGQTPKMSTYLVFFGVGDFEINWAKEDSRVRAVTLPGMAQYAQFGLEFGRKALAFSESYYGIAYPLSKMDLIAIPDFAFGAMENWGAITFRENLLLHYPQVTSKFSEQRICEVIAHEIAHQWFGNLVTPSDWKYLWLNESFATFFGYGMVDNYYPHWNIWEQFLQGTTASAMVRDALIETFAIEIPGGEHVVINTSTAPIIYNKGGSILRQVQGYIGEADFQKGLQHYLKTHAYDCAASHHLWQSLEAVSKQPISAIMQSWIEQPGFPVVEVQRENHAIVLRQKRFTYLPNDSDQKWQVPIRISLFSGTGETHRLTTLLDSAEKRIEIDDDILAYKVNDGQTGFYRVKYNESQNLAELGRRVRDKSLPPEDRWGLQNDLYALAKSGDISLPDYLAFLGYYQKEYAFLPLCSIAENLFEAYLVVAGDLRRKIVSMAVPWFETALSDIGYEPQPGEKNTISILRERLLQDCIFYGSEAVLEFAGGQFEALTRGNAVHPDIIKSVMQAGAFSGNTQVFEWFDQRFRKSEIEQERLNILSALGCVKDDNVVRKVQQFVLDVVPARNKFIPLVALAANPFANHLIWDWYVLKLSEIEQFHPMLYERVVAAIIPIAGIERTAEVKAFFRDYMQKTSKAKDVIKLSLEKLEIHLRLRRINSSN